MITVMVMEPGSTPHRWTSAVLITAFLGVPAFLWGMPTASAAGAHTHDSPVDVVAAENFWGNIAAQIGGRDVKVTSLITNPSADPHLFETNAHDAALLAQAQIVIENGAGYDTWMGSLLSADGGQPDIVSAASVLHVGGSDPNPHLWYDLPRVPRVAAAIATALTRVAPRDAATFRKNLANVRRFAGAA